MNNNRTSHFVVLTGLLASIATFAGCAESGDTRALDQLAHRRDDVLYLDPANWIPVNPVAIKESIGKNFLERGVAVFPPNLVEAANQHILRVRALPNAKRNAEFLMLPKNPRTIPDGIVRSIEATPEGLSFDEEDLLSLNASGAFGLPLFVDGKATSARLSVLRANGSEYRLTYTISIGSLLEKGGDLYRSFDVAGLPYSVFAFRELRQEAEAKGTMELSSTGLTLGVVRGEILATRSRLNQMTAKDQVYKITFVPSTEPERAVKGYGHLLDVTSRSVSERLPSSTSAEFARFSDPKAFGELPKVGTAFRVLDSKTGIVRKISVWYRDPGNHQRETPTFATEDTPQWDASASWDTIALEIGFDRKPIKIHRGETVWHTNFELTRQVILDKDGSVRSELVYQPGTDRFSGASANDVLPIDSGDLMRTTIYRFSSAGEFQVIRISNWTSEFSKFVRLVK